MVDMAAENVRVFQAVGCGACNKMGYKGRVGLYEVMEVDEELQKMIMQNATAVDLTRKTIQNGMIALRQSGLIKVREVRRHSKRFSAKPSS